MLRWVSQEEFLVYSLSVGPFTSRRRTSKTAIKACSWQRQRHSPPSPSPPMPCVTGGHAHAFFFFVFPSLEAILTFTLKGWMRNGGRRSCVGRIARERLASRSTESGWKEFLSTFLGPSFCTRPIRFPTSGGKRRKRRRRWEKGNSPRWVTLIVPGSQRSCCSYRE